MDAPSRQHWFLRKHEEGSIFGPLTFEQLAGWASSAQIAPNDSLSVDRASWIKAPMLAELGMDWIVELSSERYYGPTSLGAICEFIRLEEIDDDTFVIDTCNGERQQIRDIAQLLEMEPIPSDTVGEDSDRIPAAAKPAAAVGLQGRIPELEEALRDQRRAVAEAEERYRALQAKYVELHGSESTL